jgi:hypothetical protein
MHILKIANVRLWHLTDSSAHHIYFRFRPNRRHPDVRFPQTNPEKSLPAFSNLVIADRAKSLVNDIYFTSMGYSSVIW